MSKSKLCLLLVILGLLSSVLFAAEGVVLTDQEQAFIKAHPIIRTVTVDGGGPIQYMNAKGELKGISVKVLDEIARKTGLRFEYTVLAKTSEIGPYYTDDQTDLILGVSVQYARPGYHLSAPYLNTQTIFFANKSVSSNELSTKRFAATISGSLPEGVTQEQAIWFETREDTIIAVESGKADFGYGNAYSLAFYSMQYGLENIYIIPQGKEERHYRILFINDDPNLISIIEKGLASISVQDLQDIILEATSEVERKITISMIMDAYGGDILGLGLIIILFLISALVAVLHSHRRLVFEREKFRTISEVSNEYLFDFDVKNDSLLLYEKLSNLCRSDEHKADIRQRLTTILTRCDEDEISDVITLSLGDKYPHVFRLNAKKIRSNEEKHPIWIGKLQDISKEFQTQKRLASLAQLDGLTGVMNARTFRTRVGARLKEKPKGAEDFCILFDIDSFKTINDTLGHPHGDLVLRTIGSILNTPPHTEQAMTGRLGGDEFCIYLTDYVSKEKALSYCSSFVKDIAKRLGMEGVTLSIGITPVYNDEAFDQLYERADRTMYEAKHNGKHKIVFME